MQKKRDTNSTELALNTSENLLDSLLADATENLAEGFLKAVPFGGSIVAIGRAFSNYRDAKYYKQLVEFFTESEDTKGFSEKFFNNKDNTEIGLEILGLIERTYLPKQARMIARITRMWKEKQTITKEQFDKYSHMIMTFDSHLIKEFEKYMTYRKPIAQDQYNEGLTIGPGGIDMGNRPDEMFIYPNMTLVNHGFLRQKENMAAFILNAPVKDPYYSITSDAIYFYNNIFKEPTKK